MLRTLMCAGFAPAMMTRGKLACPEFIEGSSRQSAHRESNNHSLTVSMITVRVEVRPFWSVTT